MGLPGRNKLAALAALAALAVCAFVAATGSAVAGSLGGGQEATPPRVVVSAPDSDDASTPKVPRSRYLTKVESCVESTSFESRQVGLYAAMRPFKGTKRMQMRFTLLRSWLNYKTKKRVKGLGLDEWISVSPGAAVAIRHVVVSAVETGAVYYGRVDFRWRGESGSWKRKRADAKKSCTLTTPPPNLRVAGFKIASTVWPVSNYQIDVVNDGGSEARGVDVQLTVDGNVVATRSVESMAAGDTVSYTIGAATCADKAVLGIDPNAVVREQRESDNQASIGCK